MLLEGKTAVIYGGGGSIGGAVARAFAREGATVHLAGRTLATLEAAAESIDGAVEVAQVDALDGAAVDAHAEAVGRIDISLNAITHGDVQGTPIHEMDVEDYLRPVATAVRTTFLTATAAARRMIATGTGGVILAFGGSGDPLRGFHLGGLQTAFEAIESMRKQISSELGSHGVRFVTLRTGGILESIPPEVLTSERFREAREGIENATMIGRTATLEDVGNAAVFAASDHGRMLTAATVNISGGALID